MPDLQRVIAQFEALLGAAHVLTAPAELTAAETATFATTTRIPAILRPADRAEVAACVRLARELGCSLYPSSGGKNWGLGSRVPPGDGSLLLDLGRLDRILEYDEEMAAITLEPGVTFAALAGFLEARSSPWMMDGIGGPADASVVGNAVERGHGMGPWPERAQQICGMEVVLADGTVVETGARGFRHTKVAHLSRNGVGPALDGLFTQSNLGIVTSLTLWLQPRPAVLLPFVLRILDLPGLARVVDAIRRLKLSRLPVGIRLFNDFRILGLSQRCPWTGEEPRALGARRRELQAAHGVDPWGGFGVIHGATHELGESLQRHLQASLGQLSGPLLFAASTDEPSIFDQLFSGGAANGALAMCYWRQPPTAATTGDPHRDGCGVHWYCPMVPSRGGDVVSAVTIIDRISEEYGFEPNFGLIASEERTLAGTGALLFNRREPGEDARALACHDALLAALTAAGYPPYRLGIQSMRAQMEGDPGALSLIQRVRQTLDPTGVLAPGRYDGAASSAEPTTPQT